MSEDRHTDADTKRPEGETMSDGTQSASSDVMGNGPSADTDTMSDEDDERATGV